MILIADGGSTKTSWCFINEKHEQIVFNTEGYNPYFSDTAYIIESLTKNLPDGFPADKIEEVNYYGAGVHNDSKAKIVAEAMQVVFPQATVNIGHDLLAAARALLGNNKGFAAILGTGTNTCVYDGNDITEHIDSLAYILGDEGSGCYIGKKLLADYLRGYMPEKERKAFWETYQLKEHEILDNVYTKPLPNRFCASFSKFASDVSTPYTQNIVKTSFDDFFRNLVSHYNDYQSYSFNCIGSVAFGFKDILEEVAGNYGMKLGKIMKAPIDALVEFHKQRFINSKK